MYLNAPLRVAQDVQTLSADYFIADNVFAPGGQASGGAVLYDQVMQGFWFTGRDVQQVNPGQEFPLVDVQVPVPLTAMVAKWGGAIQFTYEDIRRNRIDKLAQGLSRLRNTITRKVDTVSIAVLRQAPIISQVASASWATATTAIVKDILTGTTEVEKYELGYKITGALISPNTELNMMTNSDLLDKVWKAGVNSPTPKSPLVSRQLGQLLNLNWYVTPRVTDDECILLTEKITGNISDEVPLYTRVVDDPQRERKLVIAGRLTVPYITNPKSCVRITGINGGALGTPAPGTNQD
jgi:hypothetical protein